MRLLHRLPVPPIYLTMGPAVRMRRVAGALAAIAAALAVPATTLVPAQAAPRIAPVRGLAVVQTLQFPDGDRESLIAVDSASAAGVRYVWRGLETHTDGDTTTFRYARFVSGADLAGAERLRIMYQAGEPLEHPSYTSWSISTAVYRQLRNTGSAPFQIMSAERSAGATPRVARTRGAEGMSRSRPCATRTLGTD